MCEREEVEGVGVVVVSVMMVMVGCWVVGER